MLTPVVRHRYHTIHLGQGPAYRIHRLVLETFVGPCPAGYEGAHRDGDPSHNTVSNLKWATHQENAAHRALHGTENIGERNGRARLTEAQAQEVLRRAVEGETSASIAKTLGVRKELIKRLCQGRTWKHLTHAAEGTA